MNDKLYSLAKYTVHIFNEYEIMKRNKNIKIRTYANKKNSLTEIVMMRQIGRKEFFRQNEASNLEKIT